MGLIGLARKAGKAQLGEEAVSAAALDHKARLILVAGDAAENTREKALRLGERGNCPVLTVGASKAQLGGAVGRGSCAVLALTDVGLAAAAVKKVVQDQPGHYFEIQARLEYKAEKTRRRKKEQRAKEKARLSAGRKPWAAPGPKEGGKS